MKKAITEIMEKNISTQTDQLESDVTQAKKD